MITLKQIDDLIDALADTLECRTQMRDAFERGAMGAAEDHAQAYVVARDVFECRFRDAVARAVSELRLL